MTLPGRLVLLGHPVQHSLSPAFQGAALHAAGIPLTYEPLDVTPEQLPRLVRLLREADAAGNVTAPHKEHMLALCDRLSPLAQHVGAVNTFWVEEGALVGDNTDVGGFDADLRERLGPPGTGAVVALLGAGGAAAAVLAAIERWPAATVRLWSRSRPRANTLAARFRGVAAACATPAEALDGADLVVNATAAHLAGALPIPVALLASAVAARSADRPPVALYDLAYSRAETELVIAARAAGFRACDGLGMLVEQGALAFERWFGRAPDRAAMWAAVAR